MSNAILKISAAVLIIASAAGWWFGAYLPFQKSKRFIEVIRSGSVIKTIDELERRFNAVLDFYSPVGEAEAIGFFADQMVNVLGTKPPADVGERLIAYTEEKARPVLENPESPELTKVFLKVASLNEVGWIIYQKEEYFRRAENYLLEGLKISPNRPQYLYGLFNLYASVGDRERVKAIGEEILRFWPNDEVMRAKVSLL
ncbi:MAG: hypothetical protein UY32_C0015G0002 [Candidatus Jorgensenbacteria bacterium GW2011_GWC1_48_8]|uniref:Tetratricopeptide repeat protein n=1 Tax=Candidatus Jorgensenbacteria bacterium GW2011_GWC1_48_8 TaxID=1618666 RepID=A0A0G1UX54_9BACT|nr:MAG: hypothetical protein UW89_C0003G0032 [Parcubacteria group bacterium GW2011_GWB1_45_10]KKU98747.1 MAG: hypothetical protein UY32_C0015G0002 [Candidatus Jorgensenbacteria bacterium GW2011_GWC1_48_8]